MVGKFSKDHHTNIEHLLFEKQNLNTHQNLAFYNKAHSNTKRQNCIVERKHMTSMLFSILHILTLKVLEYAII